MRHAYVCLSCATHYLPPESMRYEQAGLDASPVHCANPRCAADVRGGRAVPGVPVEVLEQLAVRAAERQPDPRPDAGRRARGGRPGTQRGARSRLG
jgi:hypothetical protein